MLASEFDMKDLGEANMILGMEIERDRSTNTVRLHQRTYLNKVLHRYNKNLCNSVQTPVQRGLKLSVDQATKSETEILEMSTIPYANVMGESYVLYSLL